MSRLPKAKDDFNMATYYNHRTSNEAFKKEEYSVAYRYAMEFAENVLKAILAKNGLYVDSPKWQGGDRHHLCDDLWDKIIQNDLLSYCDLQILDTLLPRLFQIDISSDDEYMDCASAEVTGFRYRDMDDFIGYDDAKEKVDLMNRVMNVLRKYL